MTGEEGVALIKAKDGEGKRERRGGRRRRVRERREEERSARRW